MTYATVQDMVVRFSAEALQEIDHGYVAADPDANPPVEEDYPRVRAGLDDAAAEIDSYLSGVYVLPLEGGPWPLLLRIACDLARYGLYANAPIEAVEARAKLARDTLAAIRDGDVRFISASGAAPKLTSGARSKGPAPVMTPENLEGL